MALETHISKAEAVRNPEQILDRIQAGETIVIDDSEGAAVAEISYSGFWVRFWVALSEQDRQAARNLQLDRLRHRLAYLLELLNKEDRELDKLAKNWADKTFYGWSAPAPAPTRRTISEALALLDPNSTAVIDPDFARDVKAAIESHREPLNPPAWE